MDGEKHTQKCRNIQTDWWIHDRIERQTDTVRSKACHEYAFKRTDRQAGRTDDGIYERTKAFMNTYKRMDRTDRQTYVLSLSTHINGHTDGRTTR